MKLARFDYVLDVKPTRLTRSYYALAVTPETNQILLCPGWNTLNQSYFIMPWLEHLKQIRLYYVLAVTSETNHILLCPGCNI